jgi:hypothetical protein
MKTRYFVPGISLAIALLSVCRLAAAQQTEAAKGVPVQMVVSIEPRGGQQVPMITPQEILVYQGQDRRPVTGWVPATGNRAGLALAILIDDASGSSLATQLNDIRTFIMEQAPTTLVAVGYMQNGTVRLAQDFTADHAAAAKSLRVPLGYFGAQGSPYLSLSDFIKRWPSDSAIPRREVLMVTSGIDSVYMGLYPNPYVETAIQQAQCAGIVAYSIYTPAAGHFGHSFWRAYWGQNFLSELSERTGGESYYFMGQQAPVAFAPYLDKMSHQLTNQFLLTFLAKPQKKAGRESVEISSEIHSVDFVHADMVCVPASPAQ